MRLAFVAGAVCLSLVSVASQPESPKASEAATIASAGIAGNEDAAKHVKRTACLKDAKGKKLLGPDRTIFLKDCMASPSHAGT
jgi:psiF repeat